MSDGEQGYIYEELPEPQQVPLPEPGEVEEGEVFSDAEPKGGWWPVQPSTLFAKLAKIAGEIEAVEKRGHADIRGKTTYSYDYILESDLMAALRPRLAAAGIAVFYSDRIIRYPGPDDNLTAVRVSLTFADAESGQTWTCTAEGQGTDTGDKGANKAKTSAVRYLLWKQLLIPSDIDPEQEHVERRATPTAGELDDPPVSPGALKFLQDLIGGNAQLHDAIVKRIGEALTGLRKSECSQLIELLKSKKAAGEPVKEEELDFLAAGRSDFGATADDDIPFEGPSDSPY